MHPAYTGRRHGETLEDAARRNAIDAVYYERDHGGTMHTAGEAAAEVVMELLSNPRVEG